jgi:hypothetical protein
MERWERRAHKLEAKLKKMPKHGRGLLTMIQPIIKKRAEEARRAGKGNHSARLAA